MVFFLQFSKKGLFLCLFIIMFCLISRKRQKLRNRPKRTFFSRQQYLSNGTKTKPLAPTFFSYDRRPVDMSQQNSAQDGPVLARQFLMMQTGKQYPPAGLQKRILKKCQILFLWQKVKKSAFTLLGVLFRAWTVRSYSSPW